MTVKIGQIVTIRGTKCRVTKKNINPADTSQPYLCIGCINHPDSSPDGKDHDCSEYLLKFGNCIDKFKFVPIKPCRTLILNGVTFKEPNLKPCEYDIRRVK